MTEIALPCPTCSGTGTDTHEDRHAGTNRDTCRTCGGARTIPAATGQSAEASAPPVSADTPQTDETTAPRPVTDHTQDAAMGADDLRLLRHAARIGTLRIQCQERLPDADLDAGMCWPIQIELACINGLSCWFTLGNIYSPDRAARGYTDDALNDDLARAFAAHIIDSLASLATPAPPPVAVPDDVRREAGFLLDRLREFEGEHLTDEGARDWHGHVSPSVARLWTLIAAQPASPGDGAGGDEAEKSYRIGKRDGYEEGVQDAALRVGHHGEYFVSLPYGDDCPDPATMLDQIGEIVDGLRAARPSAPQAGTATLQRRHAEAARLRAVVWDASEPRAFDAADVINAARAWKVALGDLVYSAVIAAPAQPEPATPAAHRVSAEGLREVKWGSVDTVGDLIAQLRTMPAEAPIYGTFKGPDERGRRSTGVRGVLISRERVGGRWIDSADKTLPYQYVIWTKPDPALASPPDTADRGGDGVYLASKTAHAHRWRKLRDDGYPIISTWIDEAGVGETACFTDLWRRCVGEASRAMAVVVYREPSEVLKGAFVEVGAALAVGRPVYAVGCDEFSFVHHVGVTRCTDLADAFGRAGIERLEHAAPSDPHQDTIPSPAMEGR